MKMTSGKIIIDSLDADVHPSESVSCLVLDTEMRSIIPWLFFRQVHCALPC